MDPTESTAEQVYNDASEAVDELIEAFQKGDVDRPEYFEMNQQLTRKALMANFYFRAQYGEDPEQMSLGEKVEGLGLREIPTEEELEEWFEG